MDSRKAYGVTVAELIGAELITPGAKLERSYRGAKLTATVGEDGVITFKSKKYASPSTAAAAARQSVLGSEKAPATNGWSFWRVRAGKESRPLEELRAELISRRVA